MADVFDNKKRSEIMRKVKSNKNKSTELRLIDIFKQNGITGWKRNYPVKGHPDFVFQKDKIAVFVDGCFWHGHDCRNTRPAENKEYWQKKRERNMKHDKEVTAMFESRGWKVLRIWECELKKKNEAKLVKKIQLILNHSSERILKAVDLFCGVGGLTYGLQKAGIPVVAGIDIDDSCEYAYAHNNNCIFIHKSVEDVTGKEIRSLLRGADVKILVGCAPCQPFSSHQKDKQNRSKHKDWKLLYQFGRLIEETRPHIVSMENVPELEKEEVFKDFVATLKSLNYFVNYQVINVANYGVPQRRKRLILLASRRKEIKLIDATHEKHLTVRDAISNLPRISAGETNINDSLHISPALSLINLERIQHSVPGGTWHDWPERLVLNCHKKESGKTYASVYGRMKWDDLSPTITTQFIGYGTGRFGHPEQDRAITLREGAILQSFPPDYQFLPHGADVPIRKIARHIGNAVPPRLGEIIGESIIRSLPKKREKKATNTNER